jgi:hypothetical protein
MTKPSWNSGKSVGQKELKQNNFDTQKKDQKTLYEFGKMIRKWRLKRNIGFRDFAIMLKISASELSRLEGPESSYQDFVNKNHD